MGRYILGIHGLRNKPPEKLLNSWWQLALREGLERIGRPRTKIPFELLYWADKLYPEPLDPKITDPDNKQYLDEPYQWNVSAEKEVRSNRLDQLRRYLEKQLHQIFLNPDLSMNYEKITDSLFQHFFTDLDKYFSTDEPKDSNGLSIRTRIQQSFLEVLDRHTDDRVLLIAHSMGSIIAYDVMINYPERCSQIDMLVTIGSPLGLSVIVGKLAQGISPRERLADRLRTPSILKGRWINYSDPEDKIAFDQVLADDYEANDKGVTVEDIMVFNDYLNQEDRNPHKSYGYLRCPEMARTIDDILGQPFGPLKTLLDRAWSWISIPLKRLWHLKDS